MGQDVNMKLLKKDLGICESKLFSILPNAVLMIALLVTSYFLIACGTSGPSNKQATEAIQEYLKDIKVFSDYGVGPYEVKIVDIGKPVTLGESPNEFPAWPVKASVLRQLLPSVPGIEKVFIVTQDPFGEWVVSSCIPTVTMLGLSIPEFRTRLNS